MTIDTLCNKHKVNITKGSTKNVVFSTKLVDKKKVTKSVCKKKSELDFNRNKCYDHFGYMETW